jgi:hypothetical protein
VLNECSAPSSLVTGISAARDHPGDRAWRGAWPLRVQPLGAQDRCDWLREKKVNVLVVTALEQSPDFPGVPAVVELVSKPEDRQLLELMVGPGAMARPFAAPPGLPANKAALIRRAFDATMADADFRAEAARMQADVAPSTGEEVQKLVARIYATPRPVIERARKLFAP